MHDFIGASPLGVRCAVKLQNQCRAIIGRAHGGPIIDMDQNGEAAILKSLGPAIHRIIDVGANVGMWTETVLKNAPGAACLLFEPSRLAVADLKKRYGASKRVVIRPVAVADSPGQMTFYEEAAHGETSSLVGRFAAATATPATVEITALDCELERIGWDLVDYLKIDAEGVRFPCPPGGSPLIRTEADRARTV